MKFITTPLQIARKTHDHNQTPSSLRLRGDLAARRASLVAVLVAVTDRSGQTAPACGGVGAWIGSSHAVVESVFGGGLGRVLRGGAQKPVRQSKFDDRAQS